jgi:hypothetical protein
MIAERRYTGLRLRAARLSEKLNTWLHFLLVAGVLVYLYSPLLDHLLDKDIYSRPHTHIYVAGNILPQLSQFRESDSLIDNSDQDEHDNGVICLLNIDTLLSLLLSIFIVPQTLLAPQDPLVVNLVTTYLDVSLIYLSSLDPPPNI